MDDKLQDTHQQNQEEKMNDTSLSQYTWFKTGGPAKSIFKPRSIGEIQYFLSINKEPYLVIGGGSNIMISDNGFPGTVILTNRIRKIQLMANNTIYAEAGVTDLSLANFARDNNLTGLEFLCTIPGTIGGGIRMNGGCNGKSIMDCIIAVDCILPTGEKITLGRDQCGFQYRSCAINKYWIIVGGLFQCAKVDNQDVITNTMEEMFRDKEVSQPIGVPSVGSTFKNPLPHSAWKLIDEAGLRGYKHGTVMVSEKHCNFIIHNPDGQTPVNTKDFLELVDIIKKKVWEKTNIKLETEVVIYK